MFSFLIANFCSYKYINKTLWMGFTVKGVFDSGVVRVKSTINEKLARFTKPLVNSFRNFLK